MTRLLRLVLAAFACASAVAQTTSTSILGTVSDQTGAAVQGARVVAVQVNTGVRSEALTTSTGDFVFPLLDVGEYTVSVEKAGFKTISQSGIRLQINEKVRVDMTLEVGAVSDRVEVSGEVALLKTDESSIGNVLEQRRVVELPLNGRNAGNLAVLQPGVQFAPRGGLDGQSGSGGGVPIPGQNIALIANGQRETNQNATLDGVIATEARVNTVPYAPTPEAIEEVKVFTGSYSAEYGFNSGAQLIMVLRSGTNQLHGAVYEFLRNSVLDAEDYFQNYFLNPGQTRFKKQGLIQNQFGATASGPVVLPKIYDGRDKTFWMFSWESRRRVLPGAAQSALVPSVAMRGGDLSALLNRRRPDGTPLPPVTIVDPLTDPSAPTPFPGNIIPSNRISTAAKNLNNYWEQPQAILPDPLTGFNYTNAGTQTINDNQYYVKMDHNFSPKDRIMGRYATNLPDWYQLPGASPQFTYLVQGRNNNIASQWLHVFSPSIINEARYGFNTSKDDSFNPRANTSFSLDSIGLGNVRVINDGNRPLTSREAGVPSISVALFQGLAELDGGNGYDSNQLHQIDDNVTITKGAHSFKVGADYRRVLLFRGAANVPRGQFNFTGDVAGNGYAAFLLGIASNTNSPEGLPQTDVRQNRWAFYGMDDWKISRKVTLNLGLRYEYNSPATDIDGLWRSLEWRNGLNSPPEFVPAQIRTVYQFYSPQKNMFMPRIGGAFRITNNWVVRAGYGIYYNIHQLNNYTILNLNPPLSGSANFNNTPRNGAVGTPPVLYTFDNPFGAVNPSSPTNANVLNTDNFQPVVNQWSLDIQRRLPWEMVLTVGYVGSKTSHLDNSVERNSPDPAFNTPTSTLQLRRPIQFLIDNGVTRPLTRLRWLDSGANAWYEGLQVNLQKRFTRGFLFNVAYTYSKSEMEGYGRNEGDGFNSNTYQNPRDRASEKGRVGWDATQNAVINFVYELPAPGFLSAGFAKFLFAGWQANGILTFRTGFPYSILQGAIINTANTPVRPDRIGSGQAANPTVNQWFNPNDFHIVSCLNAAIPQACKYGNSGNGILEGPGFKEVDFSMFKNFSFTERVKLQFRAEFFNLFNTPQFGRPNVTLNTGGGFQPVVGPGGNLVYPSQANIVRGPGAITSLVSPMRSIQFGLKLLF
jgi:hypothetical protein